MSAEGRRTRQREPGGEAGGGRLKRLWVAGKGQAERTRAAAPETLAALVGAASANRIGFQSGDCQVDLFSGPYDYQIIWYGRQSRMNSFRLSSSFFPTRCPDETTALVLAIVDYEAKIVAQGQKR